MLALTWLLLSASTISLADNVEVYQPSHLGGQSFCRWKELSAETIVEAIQAMVSSSSDQDMNEKLLSPIRNCLPRCHHFDPLTNVCVAANQSCAQRFGSGKTVLCEDNYSCQESYCRGAGKKRSFTEPRGSKRPEGYTKEHFTHGMKNEMHPIQDYKPIDFSEFLTLLQMSK